MSRVAAAPGLGVIGAGCPQLDAASNLLDKALADFGAHPQLLIDRAAIAIYQGDTAAFDYLDQAEAVHAGAFMAIVAHSHA